MFHGLISDPFAVVAVILPTVVGCSVDLPELGIDPVVGFEPVVGIEPVVACC